MVEWCSGWVWRKRLFFRRDPSSNIDRLVYGHRSVKLFFGRRYVDGCLRWLAPPDYRLDERYDLGYGLCYWHSVPRFEYPCRCVLGIGGNRLHVLWLVGH